MFQELSNLLVRQFLSIILIVSFDCLIELVYVVYHFVGELLSRLDYCVSLENLEFDSHCQKLFSMLIYQQARGGPRLLMLQCNSMCCYIICPSSNPFRCCIEAVDEDCGEELE